jgi:hypothetical protein
LVETYCSKFEETVLRLEPRARSLLDVGCRGAILRPFLPHNIAYTGTDLIAGPNVNMVCNLERGIPLRSASVDAVVALDVLEHIDNIWLAFSEMVRVARRQVIVVLPNMYHFRERMRFLRGQQRDKYLLRPEPINDRHRWVPSYDSAHRFCANQAARHGLTVTESITLDEQPNWPRQIFSRVLPLNVMAVASFHVFTKPNRQSI